MESILFNPQIEKHLRIGYIDMFTETWLFKKEVMPTTSMK